MHLQACNMHMHMCVYIRVYITVHVHLHAYTTVIIPKNGTPIPDLLAAPYVPLVHMNMRVDW